MGFKVIKIIAAITIVVPIIYGVVYYSLNSENVPFESVCEKGHDKYTDLCGNVGKFAHTKKNLRIVNDANFGKIIGVSWRVRGGIISSPGQDLRYSNSNSYYYIIKADDKEYYFLRLTSETEAK